MARTKQATPIRRETSSEYITKTVDDIAKTVDELNGLAKANGYNKATAAAATPAPSKRQAGVTELLICVGGIYASFLTWALLQERLTTTPYGDENAPERFKFPIFLNTIQSLFAATTGSLYLMATTPKGASIPPIFPSRSILGPLALVALTSSLASPFGYAALSHIDYITFILAKSCKLLPVMFLHITLFRKRYPLYKYLVVLAVTAGVAVFTLHASAGKAKSKSAPELGNRTWGILLLGINLLFDGLTNSTQDYIFGAFQPFTGPQMMCANNLMSSLLTGVFLLAEPWVATTALGAYVGMDVSATASQGELAAAVAFLQRHPAVWKDVLGFAVCGAVGQVFIFYTLSAFSSLLLVTVTVTRKMLTMILSVVWFGHRLSNMQWLGVGLVFGGVGAEAVMARREKAAKEAAKKAAAAAAKQD